MMKYIPVFAYLDPGSGSLVLQMLVGGVAAAFFTIKTYWTKIAGFFTRKRDQADPEKKV